MFKIHVFMFTIVAYGSGVVCQELRAPVVPGMENMDLKDMGEFILPFIKDMPMFQFFDFTKSNVSEGCSASMEILLRSLPKMWALKMLDSSAKIPSGVLQGGFVMFGAFDECLKISVDKSEWVDLPMAAIHNETIRGQYCTVKIKNVEKNEKNVSQAPGNDELGMLTAMVTMFFRMDLCLPSACSLKDINSSFSHHVRSDKLGMVPEVGSCQTEEPVTFTGSQITSIVIFSILGFLLFTGTALDIGLRLVDHFVKEGVQENFTSKRPVQALIAFSCYKNGLKLLDTHQSAESLTAVNGIRFLSMTWVILGHCYAFLNISIIGNINVMADLAKNFALQAVFNGFLSVDSFFFLSGLLLAYLTLKEFRKGGRLNPRFFVMFYFHRFWRLTPAVLFTILFVFVWPLMGSGPTWTESTAGQYYPCTKNWWVNLLYLQNLVKTPEMCLGHSWYLANDMQFYVISPIILVNLYLNRYVGLAVNSIFLVGSFIVSGVLANLEDLPPTVLVGGISNPKAIENFMKLNYIKPWCRIGPFCIGIFVGYLLALKRNYKIPLVVRTACWCAAIICNISVLYATYAWNSGNPPAKSVGYFYLSVHRTVWAVGLGWLTFACATGYGGIVNTILSWKPFAPLGRMTYMAYLIHPYIQYSFAGMLRERVIYTHYLYVILFLGMLVISYGFAFALSLAFEAPFLGLEKVIFAKPEQKRPSIVFRANQDKEASVHHSPSTSKRSLSTFDSSVDTKPSNSLSVNSDQPPSYASSEHGAPVKSKAGFGGLDNPLFSGKQRDPDQLTDL